MDLPLDRSTVLALLSLSLLLFWSLVAAYTLQPEDKPGERLWQILQREVLMWLGVLLLTVIALYAIGALVFSRLALVVARFVCAHLAKGLVWSVKALDSKLDWVNWNVGWSCSG